MPDQIAPAERAAFFGRPADGLALLRPVLAEGEADAPPLVRARWVAGVCALALGEHAMVADLLAPALRLAPRSDASPWVSFCCSTLASSSRQLARYAEARDLDLRARACARDDEGAHLDALVGLAADAVGLADLRMAGAHLEEAESMLTGWRAPIRLQWVHAEMDLLLGRTGRAVEASAHALQLARRAQASRHVGKSALFHAAALLAHDRPGPAVRYARIALRVVDDLGLAGLRWPTLAVLADALAARGDPGEQVRRDCADAIRAQAERVPQRVRQQWLGRPEVARRLGTRQPISGPTVSPRPHLR